MGLGGLKKTDITLYLTDRSVRYPKGVVKDVIVKVRLVSDRHIPVILGRPFLATSNAVIRCRNGVVTLSFRNMKLELNVFRNELQSSDLHHDEEVNMIDTLVDQTVQSSCYTDQLEECLAHFNAGIDIDGSICKVNALLNSA